MVARASITSKSEVSITVLCLLCSPRYTANDPNRISVKIKLTPTVDSYTTILLVQTLSITQTTQGWFKQTSFLRDVESSNGGVWPSEGPGF